MLNAMQISRPTSLRRTLTFISLERSCCLLCQWRSFSASYRRRVEKVTPVTTPTAPSPRATPSVLDEAPRAYGKAVSEFTPKPLDRPIGLPNPPRSGDNTGVDNRTFKQRRDDFVDFDKHLVRRRELTQKISTPYFREWTNMRHHKGKSFLAPPRLFKADRAFYFPNLYGETLLKDDSFRHTTPVLEGKVTIVSVFSSAWAERQAESFASEKSNWELHEVIKSSEGVAQAVHINIEDNSLKAAIVKLFMPSLRVRLGHENWGRYFLVRRGLTTELRDAIGLLNSKVGYTYLLDGNVKIRWAGSGIAGHDEKEGLVKGVKRLIEESRNRHRKEISPRLG